MTPSLVQRGCSNGCRERLKGGKETMQNKMFEPWLLSSVSSHFKPLAIVLPVCIMAYVL